MSKKEYKSNPIFSADFAIVEKEVSNFCDDMNEYVDIPKLEAYFAKNMSPIQEMKIDQTLTEWQMEERCLKIWENAKLGKPNNIVIDFTLGEQQFRSVKFAFGDTVLKIVESISRTPFYFYLKKDSVNDCKIFIGGDYAEAFMAIKDKGTITFVGLSELHLLSINRNCTRGNEIGLLTEYKCYTSTVCSSLILPLDVDPIIRLLVAQEAYAKKLENENSLETEENVDGQEKTAVNRWGYLKKQPFAKTMECYYGEEYPLFSD